MSDNDLGITITLLEKLSIEIIPKAIGIQDRLNNGEHLDHWDRQTMDELIESAHQVKPLIDRHPEHQEMYAQLVHLYKQISDQALLNESISAPIRSWPVQ